MIALELVVWMLCFLYLYIMEILDLIFFFFNVSFPAKCSIVLLHVYAMMFLNWLLFYVNSVLDRRTHAPHNSSLFFIFLVGKEWLIPLAVDFSLQAWNEQHRARAPRKRPECINQLKKKHGRKKLPNTVSIDSIYEKSFLSLSSVLEAVIVDAFLLPGALWFEI